jgi:formate hydrogenlyase subunit 3/multisubunit Na+/H+ antiporter MnhD subunit
MVMLLAPVGLLVVTGIVALACSRTPARAHLLGSAGAAVASLLGLAGTVVVLISGTAPSLSLPWNTGLGASFTVGFDALTAVFLLPIYLLGALSAVFGKGYLSHTGHTDRLGSHWFFYSILVASMALVVLSRNAVLFLIAWEVMSLSSWLLVTFEHEKSDVRRAGVTYLVATQIGTAFLLVLFLLLGSKGSPTDVNGFSDAALDFSRFGGVMGPAAGVAFLLALVGFGTKAGIVPLHVWLPEAHPAAPSHVSALMSGVMIKTGIYGLLRVIMILGAPPAWWGWTLVIVGSLSGVIGVLFALAQHDIKRLLAYHSVENIGIICIGIGVGLLGVSYRAPQVAVLGFAGGVLHVLNHALFKGLLFLGAGSASAAAGTREIDRLGGLLRRMPVTGGAFLVASISICGLPPLNGFVSEFLIFSGGFHAVTDPAAVQAAAGAVAIGAMALISGLAAACFAKAFGIVFLGEPRSAAAAAAKEQGRTLLVPMLVLAVLCIAVGLLSALAVPVLAPLAGSLAGLDPTAAAGAFVSVTPLLLRVTLVALVSLGVVGALALVRRLLLRNRTTVESGTWDCGYVKPTARMQYTASSFAQPLVDMFRGLLASRRRGAPIAALFPAESRFSTETPDTFSQHVFRPGFRRFGALLSRLRWLQHGHLQLYVLYIAVTIVILFVWRLA